MGIGGAIQHSLGGSAGLQQDSRPRPLVRGRGAEAAKAHQSVVVEPGDCAWEISARFGLSLEQLQDFNAGLTNPDLLYPGDVLLVPHDAVLRPRQLWNLRAVKARLKGIAAHANAKFFDVFPYPQGQSFPLAIDFLHSRAQSSLPLVFVISKEDCECATRVD